VDLSKKIKESCKTCLGSLQHSISAFEFKDSFLELRDDLNSIWDDKFYDKWEGSRIKVVESLGETHLNGAVQPLIHTMLNDPSNGVRYSALIALLNFYPDPPIIKAFNEKLERDLANAIILTTYPYHPIC